MKESGSEGGKTQEAAGVTEMLNDRWRCSTDRQLKRGSVRNKDRG